MLPRSAHCKGQARPVQIQGHGARGESYKIKARILWLQRRVEHRIGSAVSTQHPALLPYFSAFRPPSFSLSFPLRALAPTAMRVSFLHPTRTPSPSPRLTLINSDSTFRPWRDYHICKGGEQAGALRRDLRGTHLVVTITTPTELRQESSRLQIFWGKKGNRGGWEAHVDGMPLSSSGTSVSKEILTHQGLTSWFPKWAHDVAVVKEPWLQPWGCGCVVREGGGAHSGPMDWKVVGGHSVLPGGLWLSQREWSSCLTSGKFQGLDSRAESCGSRGKNTPSLLGLS